MLEHKRRHRLTKRPQLSPASPFGLFSRLFDLATSLCILNTTYLQDASRLSNYSDAHSRVRQSYLYGCPGLPKDLVPETSGTTSQHVGPDEQNDFMPISDAPPDMLATSELDSGLAGLPNHRPRQLLVRRAPQKRSATGLEHILQTADHPSTILGCVISCYLGGYHCPRGPVPLDPGF